MARYLTKIELKYGILVILVSIAAWEISKLRYYTTFAVEVRVVLITMADMQLLVGLASNMRLKAYIVNL